MTIERHALMFRYLIAVGVADIDEMDHVNNAVYLRWVQEAVVEYWRQKALLNVQAELLWVALRHEINYHMPILLGDRVEALVTAQGVRGSRASFTTLFKRGEDIAAKVNSVWICVDAATRKPRRIADDVAVAFLGPMKIAGSIPP